jgi:hypothetical protein
MKGSKQSCSPLPSRIGGERLLGTPVSMPYSSSTRARRKSQAEHGARRLERVSSLSFHDLISVKGGAVGGVGHFCEGRRRRRKSWTAASGDPRCLTVTNSLVVRKGTTRTRTATRRRGAASAVNTASPSLRDVPGDQFIHAPCGSTQGKHRTLRIVGDVSVRKIP